jgi:hypothetical protein
MKIISQEKNKYILRFDRGQEIVSGLENFCAENKIQSAFFIGLGAAQRIKLAFYDLKAKKYEDKEVKQDLEIASLSGNVAQMDSKYIIHCHGVFSDEKNKTVGGHVKEMEISATCEIFLAAFEKEIDRKYDNGTGLNLME